MLGALRVLQALGLAFHKGLPSVGTWLVEQHSCRPRSVARSSEGRQLPRLCWKQWSGLLWVPVSCPA